MGKALFGDLTSKTGGKILRRKLYKSGGKAVIKQGGKLIAKTAVKTGVKESAKLGLKGALSGGATVFTLIPDLA